MAKRSKRAISDRLPEPDLLPIMNIIFMLILAVLSMSAFVPLSLITSQTPKLSGAGASGAAAAEVKKEMNLTVFIRKNGFDITLFGNKLAGSIPKTIGKSGKDIYDFSALQDRLERIKGEHPDEQRIFIGADPDVIYDDVIHTMDTARETKDHKVMFPGVAFIAGVVGS